MQARDARVTAVPVADGHSDRDQPTRRVALAPKDIMYTSAALPVALSTSYDHLILRPGSSGALSRFAADRYELLQAVQQADRPPRQVGRRTLLGRPLRRLSTRATSARLREAAQG